MLTYKRAQTGTNEYNMVVIILSTDKKILQYLPHFGFNNLTVNHDSEKN